jgi:CBS-domain-containing membrane protein
MGFFVNNIYGGRQPYRVQEVQKDKPDDQGSKGQYFDQNRENSHQKFLKASEKLYKKKSVVLASEIMNKQMMQLEGDLSAQEAWEKIKHHEIKYFPILSKEGKLLGMLSERDILKGMQEGDRKKLKDLTAELTLCAEPETELADIMKVFSDQTVEVVPVIDKKHNVVGILTQNELLQTMLKISKLKWNI